MKAPFPYFGGKSKIPPRRKVIKSELECEGAPYPFESMSVYRYTQWLTLYLDCGHIKEYYTRRVKGKLVAPKTARCLKCENKDELEPACNSEKRKGLK